MLQESYLLIKPDGVKAGVIPEAIRRLEQRLDIDELLYFRFKPETVAEFYPERVAGSFSQEIIDYLVSDDCAIIRVRGEDAIKETLDVKGKTGVSGLRKDFANNFIHNTVHCPDDEDCYQRELSIIKNLIEQDLVIRQEAFV